MIQIGAESPISFTTALVMYKRYSSGQFDSMIVKSDRCCYYADKIILQYKTEYIRCTGLPVKHVAPEICVHLISILSVHKRLCSYKRLP